MKFFKPICLLLAIVLIFAGCSESPDKIEITSGELFRTKNGISAKFEIINNEPGTITELKLNVITYNDNKEIEQASVDYPIYVEENETASLTLAFEYECDKAVAVSYSYMKADGESVTGNFSQKYEAIFNTESTTSAENINTRENLANKLIKDIERQFMLQSFEAHGYYDSEKNQLVVAAYAKDLYKDCYYAYQVDNTSYQNLAKSIATMSQTCYDEFRLYKFNDVQVSIGLLSADETIMISATNGEIVEMFN